jgi:hypothetical protein
MSRKLYAFTSEEADLIGDAMTFLTSYGVKIKEHGHRDIVPTVEAREIARKVRKRLKHDRKGTLGHSGNYFLFEDSTRLIGKRVKILERSKDPDYLIKHDADIVAAEVRSDYNGTEYILTLNNHFTVTVNDRDLANLMAVLSSKGGERVPDYRW